MEHPKNDSQRLEELEQALQQARERAGSKKKLLTPRRVLLIAAVLLILNLSATSIFFASFISSSEQSDDARAATFVPTIDYGGSWSYSQSFNASSAEMGATLGFVVDSTKVEVSTRTTVTVTHQGVLPLDYLLYTCAESEIASSTPLTPTSVSGNVITYEVELPAVTNSVPFTLMARWRNGVYSEYFNGLSDTMNVTVVCEQI